MASSKEESKSSIPIPSGPKPTFKALIELQTSKGNWVSSALNQVMAFFAHG